MYGYTSTSSNSFTGFTGTFSFRIVTPPPDDGLAGCYAVLGVPPKSPPDVLRRAYRERLFETHPDHGGSNEAVREVIEAYERVKGAG